jgi:hypothetical protein
LRRETEQVAFFDKWTVVHVASGLVSGAIGVPVWAYIALGTGYELAEFAAESPRGSKIFGTKRPESALNVAGDFAAGIAGNLLGQALRRRN